MTKSMFRVLATAITFTATTALYAEGPGADIYKSKCQMCHGADGLGDTPAGKAMKAMSFKDPMIVHKSDADLAALTKTGKGKMPAYATKLSDAQIKDVITYIRTLQK